MRVINILVGGAVMAASIVVSFAHSIELFRLAGFSARLALVGVLMTELGFIGSALNIVVSRLRHERAGGGARAGMALGLSIVLWSNVRAGMAAGPTGVIIGAVIPLWLIISEITFSQAIMRRRESTAPAKPEPQEQPAAITPPAQVEEQRAENEPPAQEEHRPPKLQVVKREEPAPAVDALQIAQEMYQTNGRKPTRRQLAEAAGCTEWRARHILEKLEANI